MLLLCHCPTQSLHMGLEAAAAGTRRQTWARTSPGGPQTRSRRDGSAPRPHGAVSTPQPYAPSPPYNHRPWGLLRGLRASPMPAWQRLAGHAAKSREDRVGPLCRRIPPHAGSFPTGSPLGTRGARNLRPGQGLGGQLAAPCPPRAPWPARGCSQGICHRGRATSCSRAARAAPGRAAEGKASAAPVGERCGEPSPLR